MINLNPLHEKMTDKVPVCQSSQKIGVVKEYILKNVSKIDTIDYIYVLSKTKKLKGVISIKELFQCEDEKNIRDIMNSSVVKSYMDTDQEKIAHLALKNNIKSIPIVNKKNKFLGVIPSDEILYILDHETKEDLMRMTGIIPHQTMMRQDKMSILKSFKYRTPWIILGLFGGLFAAKIIGQFESILEKEIMLAAFIPLVVYLANAVGAQTQTMYIRDLAISKEISFLRYSLKQITISMLIGGVCWLTIILISLLIWESQSLGIIVGFSVFGAILAAVIFALGIPYILEKLKKDPAIGSGPFTTIIQDILSVVIYFLIASIFIF